MTTRQSIRLLSLPDEVLEIILNFSSFLRNGPQLAGRLASPTGAPQRGNWRVLPLVLTCRRFHRLALPLLYRHVSVLDTRSANNFMSSVHGNPGLGAHVITLDINLNHFKASEEESCDADDLLCLLQDTVNLEELLLWGCLFEENMVDALAQLDSLGSLVLNACVLEVLRDNPDGNLGTDGLEKYFRTSRLVNFAFLDYSAVSIATLREIWKNVGSVGGSAAPAATAAAGLQWAQLRHSSVRPIARLLALLPSVTLNHLKLQPRCIFSGTSSLPQSLMRLGPSLESLSLTTRVSDEDDQPGPDWLVSVTRTLTGLKVFHLDRNIFYDSDAFLNALPQSLQDLGLTGYYLRDVPQAGPSLDQLVHHIKQDRLPKLKKLSLVLELSEDIEFPQHVKSDLQDIEVECQSREIELISNVEDWLRSYYCDQISPCSDYSDRDSYPFTDSEADEEDDSDQDPVGSLRALAPRLRRAEDDLEVMHGALDDLDAHLRGPTGLQALDRLVSDF